MTLTARALALVEVACDDPWQALPGLRALSLEGSPPEGEGPLCLGLWSRGEEVVTQGTDAREVIRRGVARHLLRLPLLALQGGCAGWPMWTCYVRCEDDAHSFRAAPDFWWVRARQLLAVEHRLTCDFWEGGDWVSAFSDLVPIKGVGGR